MKKEKAIKKIVQLISAAETHQLQYTLIDIKILKSALNIYQEPVEYADTEEIKIEIGDNIEGGVVVYVDESGQHGLIAAENDLMRVSWNETIEICKEYRGGGFDDWRLPTKDELNLLYLARKIGVGGFVASIYWSSSEYSAADAWCQDFSNGGQYVNNKNYNYYVRAVRSF